MSQPADRLFAEAQALSEEERALLALQLLDSVGEPEIDGGRTTLATWDEARRGIFNHCRAAEDHESGSDDPLAWEGDGWEACTEGRR
jgi:hypothetical protein